MELIRVRIGVAIDSQGNYAVVGFKEATDGDLQTAFEFLDNSTPPEAFYIVEACIPLPTTAVIQGKATEWKVTQ